MERKNAWNSYSASDLKELESLSKDYRNYLSKAKTERLCVDLAIADANKNGFKNLEDSIIMIVDPMLATGGSAIAAIDMMKKRGAKNIRLVCLVGAPEGAKAVQETHPDVDIYLAAMDDHLNEIGYIVPGLGDAGDRIFCTK